MDLRICIDDELLDAARTRAELMGTSVEQLVSEYLEQLAGCLDLAGGFQGLEV